MKKFHLAGICCKGSWLPVSPDGAVQLVKIALPTAIDDLLMGFHVTNSGSGVSLHYEKTFVCKSTF
jgi:hypothetical protein